MRILFCIFALTASMFTVAEQQYSVWKFTDDTAFKCSVAEIFVKADKKVYQAPDNLKYFTLTFVNEMDDVMFETKNGSSIYTYEKNDLGINYVLESGSILNFIDIFASGKVVMELTDRNDRSVGVIQRAYCPDLRLAIRRV
jgi:hypothetical protein